MQSSCCTSNPGCQQISASEKSISCSKHTICHTIYLNKCRGGATPDFCLQQWVAKSLLEALSLARMVNMEAQISCPKATEQPIHSESDKSLKTAIQDRGNRCIMRRNPTNYVLQRKPSMLVLNLLLVNYFR